APGRAPAGRRAGPHGPFAAGWNILSPRLPRDSRYAIKSRISSSLNVSRRLAGIIDTFDGSIDSTCLRVTVVIAFASVSSVLTLMFSAWRLTIRPATVLPDFVSMTTAAYWSLMTLLGSTIDSNRSRTLNRPAAPVRSGPLAPPSLPKRWHAKHVAWPN